LNLGEIGNNLKKYTAKGGDLVVGNAWSACMPKAYVDARP
jgi:hypothetical protein